MVSDTFDTVDKNDASLQKIVVSIKNHRCLNNKIFAVGNYVMLEYLPFAI